ncbi:MAG: hypothetical protein GY854_09625 [Deltaproteobacteria bacterium]|nr:hypothetical protein [Deltaproteobacteria bacterium]
MSFVEKCPRYKVFFFCFLLFVAIAENAHAEDTLTGTLHTMNPRPIGLGGTLRASPSGTTGIYMNPAVLAMVPLYHIELMYQYTGEEQKHMGGLAVVDSITTFIAAGLAFNYSGIRQQRTEHDEFDGRLALSGGIGDVFFIGLTGRYIHVEQNKSSNKWGPIGKPALPASGSQQVDGFTFDAGTAFRLGDVVTLGVVGYNLSNTGSVFAPLELGGGVGLHLLKMLLIEVNGVVDFTSHTDPAWDLHFGTELFLARRVAIRAGYIYDIYYNLHTVTAGLGYVDTHFSLDVGFQHEIIEEGRMLLAFGFKYFIN